MTKIVEFVAIVLLQLPTLFTRPWVRVLRVNRPRRVKVSIGLLRRPDLVDQSVHVRFKLRIGLHVEGVGDRDLAVDLQTWGPEGVVEMDGCERDRLNRVVARRADGNCCRRPRLTLTQGWNRAIAQG